ncbi:hypothetical protein JMJ55_02210 [Belnapia sp. T6]|uniref:Tetratricopeptide repeat-containing protein n=1 Tax=Belnapia mucosa TaxID=2804532 RepID=A0ABS1V1F0_9PROT|nr:hypothetical protein [Belnapia mucosa]MBL6454118.1 hypothetical protein [Belnapia mucosa]
MRGTPLLLLGLLLAPAAAGAEGAVGIRVGNHPNHGRVVFDWPAPPGYQAEQAEGAVVLRFPPGSAIDLAGARRPPRNVLGVTAEGEAIRIALRPGARTRIFRVGPKVVVDALDPAPAQGQVQGQSPPPTQPAQAARPAPPPATSAPAPVVAAAPAPTEPPAASAPRAVRPGPVALPFPPGTGAAVLRRGGQLLALFDSAAPLDLAALRARPGLATLEAEALPGATLLRLPLAPEPPLLRREGAGWVLDPAGAGAGQPMPVEAEGGAASRLLLRAATPGRVVPLTDPESGLPLLVGTVRAGADHQPTARRLPELDLPPTLLGLAVLARSDRVTLRAGEGRFLIGAGEALALDPAAVGPAPAMAPTRIFDLPNLPPAQLLDRLRALQASIAAAPPLTRLPLRRAAGETLLALGLPQEAQSMLDLAGTEDPRAAGDAPLAALTAAAALLAGRLPQAAALRNDAQPASDEVTLWRAALAAAEGEPARAAPGFAATLPLLFDYPEALRARLLPRAALALAEAGALDPLRQLLDRAGPLPTLALPRAMLAEAEGQAEAALAAYDTIAAGRDRPARARALRRAVELRLANGKLDAAGAARALDATLFAWRDEAEEIAARLRLAELRRDSGDASGALALLRETEALFPDQAARLRPAIGAAFLAALAQEPPLAAVALFDAYPAWLPEGSAGEAALLALADRLAALDLGDRAAALLGRAAVQGGGPGRAALGLRQAGLLLAEGNATAALAALEASATPELPASLLEARSLLQAQADVRLGRGEAAEARLRALGVAGAEALAQLLAERGDWAGAAAAFAQHLRDTLPAMPAPLTEAQQRLLLRQAAMLVLAGDEAALATLRAESASRLSPGPLAAGFILLTAERLRGLADLPRLQRELSLFRTMPARLEALRAGGPVTR